MNTSEIQDFLNSKVPVCDTNHAAKDGNNPPFTCLKDYSENAPTTSGDSYCSPIVGGQRPAASIIKAVAIGCGINPQVLIVILQKEQGLVTDTWPWDYQYQFATGFCVYDNPDSIPPACQGTSGFFNQVYYAARQFKRYAATPASFIYQPYQTISIPKNPDGRCDSTPVYINNQATASLYNYTPFQPNTATVAYKLGNGPVVGSGYPDCGAFGNINFFIYFNNWFGSPYFSPSTISMTNVAQPNFTPALGETITYTASFRNNTSTSITLDSAGIVGRLGNITGINRDFGWQGPITLAPNGQNGDTWQYSFTTTVQDLGTLYVWPAVNYKGIYLQYNNWGAKLDTHIPNIGAILNPTQSALTGQTDNFSVTIRNFESRPINLDAAGIPIRFYGVYNYDAGWTPSVSIPGNGGTTTITGTVTYDKPGPYTEWVSAKIGSRYITISPTYNVSVSPPSPNTSNIQLVSYSATPNPNPALGEDVIITYTLKNTLPVPIALDAVGIVGRYDNPYTGSDRYFDWHSGATIAAGGTTTFSSFTSNISDLRTLYAWPAVNYQGKYIHYNNWGFMMTPHIPNLTLSAPLRVNGDSPAFGVSNTVTATIKNNEPNPIRYTAIGLPARYYGVYNYDAAWQGINTLAASGQSTDHVDLSGTITFDKHGPYTVWAAIQIHGKYYTVGSPQNLNL
jgi:hypothetical protein